MLPGFGTVTYANAHLHHVSPNISYSPIMTNTQQWPAWGGSQPLQHHVVPSVSYSPIQAATQQWPNWGQPLPASQQPLYHHGGNPLVTNVATNGGNWVPMQQVPLRHVYPHVSHHPIVADD